LRESDRKRARLHLRISVESYRRIIAETLIENSAKSSPVFVVQFWWNEAGFSRDVIIRGNVVRHVAYAPGNPG
jgi:hypothetical protein